MKVTTKGQVTIPRDIRKKLNIHPGSEVEFLAQKDAVVIVKAKNRKSRGRQLVERMRGTGSVKLTTDEIMALTRGR